MPHWISESSRPKGQVFICSECKKSCNCIKYVGGYHKKINICDYKYCPYCGVRMKGADNDR